LTTILTTTGGNLLSEDDAMGLYRAIDLLPEGARLKYESADGTTVEYEPVLRGAGRLDVIVRKRSNNATGKQTETSHEYEDVEREWCDRQEQVLRDLGIDPNEYTAV
jgi:hypothetical protein